MKGFAPRPVSVRFWPRVTKGDGCWEWQGARSNLGYGRVRGEDGRTRQTHHIAWELVFGPIPSGLVVMHICDNPPCVRPNHLRLGTVAENNADMTAKGRRRSGLHEAAKTHCPQGHPYDEENTRVHGRSRYCRACQRERARVHVA